MKSIQQTETIKRPAPAQEAIRELVEEWNAWWREVRELGIPHFGEMACRLQKIRTILCDQFEAEEVSPPLDHPESQPQTIQEQIHMLRRQHAEILVDLNSLITRLNDKDCDNLCWGEARNAFETILDDLAEHEYEEDQLLAKLNSSQSGR